MSRSMPYSATRDDLFFPCKRGNFFPAGSPATDAVLCAEMSRLAYCREAKGFAFDQGKIKSVLGGIGFAITTPQFFESQGRPQHEGTHAFLAVRQGGVPAQQVAVVAFRGTDASDPSDIGTNLDIILEPWEKGGNVHTGFANALGDVRGGLEAALATVPKGSRLLFTGHSLGAALATLLASLQNPAVLYTFGSPCVGDAGFVATLEAVDSRRYVDCCDLVTRLPPLPDYAHVGQPYYIDRGGTVSFNPGTGFREADGLAARAEYLVEYAWKNGNLPVRDLADHAPINYVSAVS